jgi:hypothetical protein
MEGGSREEENERVETEGGRQEGEIKEAEAGRRRRAGCGSGLASPGLHPLLCSSLFSPIPLSLIPLSFLPCFSWLRIRAPRRKSTIADTVAALQSFLLDICLAIGDDPRSNPASGGPRRAETW